MKYADTVRETARIYAGLLRQIGGHAGMFWVSQGLAVSMDMVYSVVIARSFQNIIDHNSANGALNGQAILMYLLAVLLVTLLWGFGDSYISARLQDGLQSHWRRTMFDRLLASDGCGNSSLQMGDLGKRYSSDVKNAAQFLVRRISSSIISPLLGGIGCFVLLMQIHPLMALVALIAGFAVFLVQKLPVPRAEEYASAQLRAESDYSSDMYDVMRNLPVIRMFHADALMHKRICRDADHVYAAGVKVLKTEVFQKLILVGGQFVQTLALVVTGALLMEQGKLSMGGLFAAILYAEGISFLFDGVSRGVANVQSGRTSAMRVLEILELPSSVRNVQKPVDARNTVEAENLTFAVDGRTVLDSICFSLGAGEKVAVMGKSGCGKTTLARMLSGLAAPVCGSVRLDLQQVWYVPAAGSLLAGSVLENITCFEENPDREKARSIAQSLGLETELLEQDVKDHGETVSGGQRQRIIIARALYSEREISIFDEPTAALDTQTAERVMDTILERLKDKTVLLITHDESVAARMERQYILQEGKLLCLPHRREPVC